MQLKLLLKEVKMAAKGESVPDENRCAILTATKGKHLKRPQTLLQIASKSDYPFQEGFPKSLEQLHATNCGLTRFDTRILKLSALKSLDLRDNKLSLQLDEMKFDCLRQLSTLL